MKRLRLFGAAIAAVILLAGTTSSRAEDGPPALTAPDTTAAPQPEGTVDAFACYPKRTGVKYSTGPVTQTTSSSSFVPVTDTKIRFKPKTDSCLLVQFSAEVSADPKQAMGVRAVLDGSIVLGPGEIQLVGDTNYWQNHTVNFYLKKVPFKSGKHKVQIEVRSLTSGNVYVRNRSMKIEHE